MLDRTVIEEMAQSINLRLAQEGLPLRVVRLSAEEILEKELFNPTNI